MWILLREECPNTELFFGPYFPVFGLITGKYGPEITPYLDTFHAVSVGSNEIFRFFISSKNLDS